MIKIEAFEEYQILLSRFFLKEGESSKHTN